MWIRLIILVDPGENEMKKAELEKRAQEETQGVMSLLKRQNQMLGQSLVNLDHFLFLNKNISKLHFDDISKILAEKLPFILSIRYFTLFLYDRNKRILNLACHNHPHLDPGLSIPLEKSGVMHDALMQRRYILEVDFTRSKYFKGKKNPLFRNDFFVCVPLMIENEIIGVINLNDSEKGTFSVEDLDFVLTVIEFISLSISNALLHEKTEILSVTDGLTQLNNHRQMQIILKSEFIRSKRYNAPLSLVMMDVDHFKKVNDTYGHQIGDKILVALAVAITRVCRANDSAARYGGEEFLLILPETTIAGANRIAERIRKEFSRNEFLENGERFKVTVSCGVTELDKEHMISPADLIQVADKALYQAKQGGRNRTVTGKWNANAGD